MSNCISRAELDEISEGLIKGYIDTKNQETRYVDIEDFIQSYLKLKIEYVSFADKDKSILGFLSDGVTPLSIYKDKKIMSSVFPKDTIVIDKYLLSEKETGRRRFTLAHEASHHVLDKIQCAQRANRFHKEFDTEKSYTKDELTKMLTVTEWQADTMAATLLMPSFLMKKTLRKFAKSDHIKIYGDNTFCAKDKMIVKDIAKELEVSYSALFIRLKNLKMLEYHNISEYILNELNIGGAS